MGRHVCFLLLSVLMGPLAAGEDPIQQIHLTFTGDETVMAVEFVSNATEAGVMYGCGLGPRENYVATTSFRLEKVGVLHRAEMKGLEPRSECFYRANISTYTTSWINFTAGIPLRGDKQHIAAVYGDFGIDNGKSMDQLTEQGRARVFDFTLHIGDIAYNLWDRGDAFMNAISGWARHSPYMVAVGNHEHKDNFTHWNAGLIHYIAINTESYKFPDETANSPFPFTHEEQLEWLEADLREAQANREKQPWIVMYGHKGWYMNVWDKNEKHITTNFTGFDALADQYGVDLYLTGHVHLYQRFLPLRGSADIRRFAPPSHVDRDCASRDKHVYYNPKHMTTIVAGSPGDKELSFVGECAAMGLLNDVAFKSSQVECRDSYGFGLLQAHNSTHLSWIWEETARPSLPPVTMLVDDGSQGHQEEKVGAASVGNSKYKDHLWLVKDRP